MVAAIADATAIDNSFFMQSSSEEATTSKLYPVGILAGILTTLTRTHGITSKSRSFEELEEKTSDLRLFDSST